MTNSGKETLFWKITKKNQFSKKISMNLMTQSTLFSFREVVENVISEYKAAEGQNYGDE
jgi:hypothetical protein